MTYKRLENAPGALDDFVPSSLINSEIPAPIQHSLLDTGVKPFGLFDSTNFSDLILSTVSSISTLSPLSPLSTSTSVSTCISEQPSLTTIKTYPSTLAVPPFSSSDIPDNAENDEMDYQYGDKYAISDDGRFLRYFVDLDLLDDYAMDLTDFKSSTSTSCNRHTISLLPCIFNSVTANIWSNTYSQHNNALDDDEFDPTQSLSFVSSTTNSFDFTQSQHNPIDMLSGLIPHYSKQQLLSTLVNANYDMDYFLELVSSHGDNQVSYTKKRQVCRHFLLGDCHRQDCQFAHDISTKVCRFWLQGTCLKEDQCDYAHSFEPINLNHSNGLSCADKEKRRRRRKPKRKINSASSPSNEKVTTRYHSMDEDFPALSIPPKLITRRPSTVTPTLPTNFAQVVAKNKK